MDNWNQNCRLHIMDSEGKWHEVIESICSEFSCGICWAVTDQDNFVVAFSTGGDDIDYKTLLEYVDNLS